MDKTKVYVTGSSGLVGSRFVELYSDKYNFLTPEIDEVDITDVTHIKKFIFDHEPKVVVNFAAFTDVNEASNQRGDKFGLCYRVNVDGVKSLAEATTPRVTHLIHISTDMVFPGSSDDPGPYAEDHKLNPDTYKLTWYGYTKALSERYLMETHGDWATILRLIYPVRASYRGKMDFLRKFLSLYDQNKLPPLFNDQYLSLTFIDEACKALDIIIEGQLTGIYHASSRDLTTPYEIVNYLLERSRGIKGAVKFSSLDEFLLKEGNAARYPKFGGLKVENTEKSLGINFSSWKDIVNQLAEQGITHG